MTPNYAALMIHNQIKTEKYQKQIIDNYLKDQFINTKENKKTKNKKITKMSKTR